MKRCKKCGEWKPLDDFYKASGTADGHRNDCRPCNLAAKHERYTANPEPYKARTRQWQQENAERYAENQRRFKESGRKAVASRKSHLKRKYGMTLEDYDRLLEQQGGGCAVCGRPPREDISLHVDHDHDTGHIRGILCFRCNNGIGDFGHDLALLEAAAAYLRRTAAA